MPGGIKIRTTLRHGDLQAPSAWHERFPFLELAVIRAYAHEPRTTLWEDALLRRRDTGRPVPALGQDPGHAFSFTFSLLFFLT